MFSSHAWWTARAKNNYILLKHIRYGFSRYLSVSWYLIGYFYYLQKNLTTEVLRVSRMRKSSKPQMRHLNFGICNNFVPQYLATRYEALRKYLKK